MAGGKDKRWGHGVLGLGSRRIRQGHSEEQQPPGALSGSELRLRITCVNSVSVVREVFLPPHDPCLFLKFMEGPLIDGLYWDSWYGNKQLYSVKNSSRIYYENVLLGIPRVRQLRVRNNTCKVYPAFQSLVSDCYSKYTVENEDFSDFGLKRNPE